MITKELIVKNRAGIHARPASAIVKTAARFKSEIFFEKEDMVINAKSIMGIITLGATFRTKITCKCEGPDEVDMIHAMEDLFENRFEL